MIHLDDMLVRITQDDVVNRRYSIKEHLSYIPDFEVAIQVDTGKEAMQWMSLSRQMVLYCVERRKAWRLLQSKAGIDNLDYQAQRSLLKKQDEGSLERAEFLASTGELFAGRIGRIESGEEERSEEVVGRSQYRIDATGNMPACWVCGTQRTSKGSD